MQCIAQGGRPHNMSALGQQPFDTADLTTDSIQKLAGQTDRQTVYN